MFAKVKAGHNGSFEIMDPLIVDLCRTGRFTQSPEAPASELNARAIIVTKIPGRAARYFPGSPDSDLSVLPSSYSR